MYKSNYKAKFAQKKPSANRRRLAKSPKKGGDAMSMYESIVILFLSMNFILGLMKFIIYLVDIFSKRK